MKLNHMEKNQTSEELSLEIKNQKTLANEKEKFTMKVAMTTSLIAFFAAISGLLATRESNLALINQIKAANKWAFFEAKTIKRDVKMLDSLNDQSKIEVEKIKQEIGEIKASAEIYDLNSEKHIDKLTRIAMSVTLFQLGIAASAISLLTRKKQIWYASMVTASIGIVLLILGIAL